MKTKVQTQFERYTGDFHDLYDKSCRLLKRGHKIARTPNNRRQRQYILDQLAQRVTGPHVAECGVFRGSSAYIIASRIQNVPGIQLHLFDSFKGLSPIGPRDQIKKVTSSFRCSVRVVQNNLRHFKFIKYYPGWIPERFDEVKDLTFSLVHIDVDMYQPTYDSLAFFYPRLQKGGMIAFDDYGTLKYPGARNAINAYLADKKDHFFLETPAGEAVLLEWVHNE